MFREKKREKVIEVLVQERVLDHVNFRLTLITTRYNSRQGSASTDRKSAIKRAKYRFKCSLSSLHLAQQPILSCSTRFMLSNSVTCSFGPCEKDSLISIPHVECSHSLSRTASLFRSYIYDGNCRLPTTMAKTTMAKCRGTVQLWPVAIVVYIYGQNLGHSCTYRYNYGQNLP